MKSDYENEKESSNRSLLFELIRKEIPRALPLIPKSYFVEDEGAMTGSLGKIFMLKRFKGQDRLADLLNQDFYISGMEGQNQQNITLCKIFSPFGENGEIREDIVYYRDIGVDQNKALTIAEVSRNGSLFNTNKLDVKRLLKSNISCTGK